MANRFAGEAQDEAIKMTQEQITKAVELAAAATYDRKVDPAFVGAVLIALATNCKTAADMKARVG
jgi:hypothetical protein